MCNTCGMHYSFVFNYQPHKTDCKQAVFEQKTAKKNYQLTLQGLERARSLGKKLEEKGE